MNKGNKKPVVMMILSSFCAFAKNSIPTAWRARWHDFVRIHDYLAEYNEDNRLYWMNLHEIIYSEFHKDGFSKKVLVLKA